MNKLQVKNGKLQVKDVKNDVKKPTPTPTPKKKYAEIYGVRLGAKPNANLRIAVKVFEANQNKVLTWSQLFELYKKELIKNDYKIDKNTKGRLRRILSRTNLSGLARESVQGLKYNLNANYKGIKVILKTPFIQNSKFNVEPSQVYENTYKFIFAKKVNRIMKADLTDATKKKLELFKAKVR